MKLTRTIRILNPLGLHARPAAEFVKCTRRFRSQVFLVKGEERYNGGSILELLTGCFDYNTEAILEVEGPDAETAISAFEALMDELSNETI